jgi:hypothetical protein
MELVESAFRGKFQTFIAHPDSRDLEEALRGLEHYMEQKLRELVMERGNVKFQIFTEVEYTKGEIKTCGNFKTKGEVISKGDVYKIKDLLDKAFKKIINERNECVLKSSGHSFGKVKSIELRINQYSPLS